MKSLPAVGGISPSTEGFPAGILDHHARALKERGLTAATIAENKLTSETRHDRIGAILKRKKGINKLVPAIVIPFHFPDGSNGYFRVRPDITPILAGKPSKYLAPVGEKIRVYFPAGVLPYLQDVSAELLISEGEFKALAATQHGFPCVGIAGVNSWNVAKEKRLLPDLEAIAWRGREVRIVFDNDITEKPSVQNAESWLAKMLQDRGAKVRVVSLPAGPAKGLDDFLVSQGDGAKAALRKLLDTAGEPLPVDPAILKRPGCEIDPAPEAAAFIRTTEENGVPRLRYHRGSFYYWHGGRYVELDDKEARDLLIHKLNLHYSHLNGGIIANVLEQARAASRVPSINEPPFWIEEPPDGWADPKELLLARNGIVNLAAVKDGKKFILPATPSLFTQTAIPCEFHRKSSPAFEWEKWLKSIWPDDPESIECLQEIMGYTLVQDTSQQKIFALYGPPRSGKGTIARVWQGILGEQNVCGPTLSGLASNFGLQSLYGKPLAIISDARLSGRADQAIVVERILRISGEDAVDVERKHLPSVTCKLPTRIVLISNELPRLGDSSGALASRFITLVLKQSFLGREDVGLTRKLLEERQSILIWMYEGWQRLRDRGSFTQPASSLALHQTMEDLSSPVKAFVKERCVLGVDSRTRCEDLYAGWRKWCDDNGREASSSPVFGRDMAAAYPNVERKLRRTEDARSYSYFGIKLLPDTSLSLDVTSTI